MTVKVKWKLICSIFLSLELVHGINTDGKSPSEDFIEYAITKPKIYHGRSKREITSTLEENAKTGHAQDIILHVSLGGVERVVELTLNHDLIGGSYFEKTQRNGSYHIHSPTAEEMELCHYRGYIRHVTGSWAALSTCTTLKGIIYDGNETYFVDAGPEEGFSYVYNGKHLKTDKKQSCGFPQNHTITRLKRDADTIRGPYNANRQSRYVELLLVVDHEEYKELGDVKAVYQHCKDIANIINALFVPLNIFITLIGVVVWTEIDEISLSTNGDTTLTNFLHYRREILVKEHPNDNAQLLTRIQFEAGVVGKALKGPICTFEYSGGVFMDHSNVVGLVATTVAHELGHNFGMEHDTPDCQCPDERCIMASSSSSMSPTHWSSCSLEYLALAFEHGMDYCLRNKPERLFDSPVCGNDFVEPGEQCDCGLPHRCDNPCCNSTSCMLLSNASCATGECCDFQTCKPKNAGTICRTAEHECDLPEYCTGESEYCPGDVYKIDGELCNGGKAFCYQGACRTHSDQCQLLWGPSGNNSDIQCYDMNTKGTRHGNCGYNRLNQTYIQCVKENVYCGMVHCSHFNERLEFGMESVSILSHSFINKEGNIIACRTAIVDLGLNEIDPGLAPDGAKCGEGKMCVNQKCMSVGALRRLSRSSCPGDCNGNGVCNSKGHCHCAKGFAPPLCDYPGTGGSTDSGPASDPNMGREFTIALYVIFLCIIPLLALAFIFTYYTKKNAKIWWKKSPTRLNNAPWECKRQSHSGGTTVLLPESVGVVDVGIMHSNRSVGSKTTLPNETSPSQPKSFVELQSNLFGKGKGFAIKPLKKQNNINAGTSQVCNQGNIESSILPSTSARYENIDEGSLKGESAAPGKLINRQNSSRNDDGRLRVISPPTLPDHTCYKNTNVTFCKKPKSSVVTEAKSEDSIPCSITLPSRPQISHPVLEGTTASDLILDGAPLVPTRKAPEIPKLDEVSCPINNLASSIEKYEKEAPPVPVHGICFNQGRSFEATETDNCKLVKELKERKEYPSLVKLASLMKNASVNVNRSPSINERSKVKVKTEPKKNKFDREKLKSIEISNPIPQLESELLEKETNIVRTHSMREQAQAKPNIPNFGSLRVGSAKRPTSIHVPNRPTSPPPRPPPKCSNQEYAYDDCLNLLTGKSAPLAHIDEEGSTPSPNNIYAVIEESPKLETERKVHFKDENHDVDVESKSPQSLNNANVSSSSTESMGLLGEIVSEIQARNLDSIYSSGTLKKKKEEENNKEQETCGVDNSIACNERLSRATSDASSSSTDTRTGHLNQKNLNTSELPKWDAAEPKNPSAKFLANKTVNEGTYKPYSSSLKRNFGPLGLSSVDKVAATGGGESESEKKVQTLNASVSSSLSKPSFTRPLLLSTPVPPKFTPQDITSSISKPELALETPGKSVQNSSLKKPTTNLHSNDNIQRTQVIGNGSEIKNALSMETPKSVIQASTKLSEKAGIDGKGNETVKLPARPLPSPPRKLQVQGTDTVSSRPLPAIPTRGTRENMSKIRKQAAEKKPEMTESVQRKHSVKQLQRGLEESNKKAVPPSAASKPNFKAKSVKFDFGQNSS